MRVCIIALSTGNAMGQYLEGLLSELSTLCEIYLIAPKKNKLNIDNCTISYVDTGQSKKDVLINFVRPSSYKTIINAIEKIRPDLVHIFNAEGYPWNVSVSNFCNTNKIPLVVTVHDPVPHPHSIIESLNGSIRRKVIKKADTVHIHNKLFIPILEKDLKIDSQKMYVIPHGSIADRYLKFKKDLPKENFVLFFGRVEEYKGLEYLVEAMKLVDISLNLVIAGAGKLPTNITSIKDRVRIKNYYISEEEACTLFEEARMLVLPYIQASQSSLPQIAKEFNLPVVATSVGALGIEVLSNGGLVVPPKDPISLGEAITSIINNHLTDQIQQKDSTSDSLKFSNIAPLFLDMYTKVVKNANIL